MKLYAVEAVDYPAEPIMYYWAENEADALDQCEAQVLNPELDRVASPVWASNEDYKYRGYVINND